MKIWPQLETMMAAAGPNRRAPRAHARFGLAALGLYGCIALQLVAKTAPADDGWDSLRAALVATCDVDDEVLAAFEQAEQQSTAQAPGTGPPRPLRQPGGAAPRPRPPAPATPGPITPSPGMLPPAQFDVGSAAGALGGARGPQSTAPYMIGDLFGVGQSSITIPQLSAPGTPFSQTLSTVPVPVTLPVNFPNAAPVTFTTPNNQLFFPSRTFTAGESSAKSNANFLGGQTTIPLLPQPQYNKDVQNYLDATHPAGSVLPTGQTATGTGTAKFTSGAAVYSSGGDPVAGLTPSTNYTLQNTYLYVPNVVFGGVGASGLNSLFPNPASSGAALLGINKISENTSPLPRDRVFVNYNLYDGTQLAPGGPSVNRFTPGFEKTFFDRRMSFEMRFPFAASINPDLLLNNGTVATSGDVVFGNISAVLKGLLYQDEKVAFSAGLQAALPTAPTLSLSLADGTKVVAVENRAVHLMPFFGALYTPNERFFAQGFLQADVDANGNPVAVNPTLQSLTPIGRIHDPTLLYIDLNAGYWLYRGQNRGLTGFAPTLEYHHNQSASHSQFLASQGFMIGSNLNQVSFDSITVGCYFEYNYDNTLSLGYNTPLGNGADRQFQGELRAYLTHRFGTPSRAARVGF
jgi:hypothetical protein